MSEAGHGRLCRLLLVRAGATAYHAQNRLVGVTDLPLSDAGRAELCERRRHWEWADSVVASPLRRARESAEILASEAPILLLGQLRARSYGHWEGLRPEEIERSDPVAYAEWQRGRPAVIPRGEPLDAFRARVWEATRALCDGARVSPLVVCHGDVIRELAQRLLGRELPDRRPLPGELVLLTRRSDGQFRLGRASSDPMSLRSPLEREGLSGIGSSGAMPEGHIAPLEVRVAGLSP